MKQEDEPCDECKERFQLIKKDPPCERCWPGINEKNIEAWEVYQIARTDEVGLTVSGIRAACQSCNAKDHGECLMKIREIIGECQKIRKGKESEKGDVQNFKRLEGLNR